MHTNVCELMREIMVSVCRVARLNYMIVKYPPLLCCCWSSPSVGESRTFGTTCTCHACACHVYISPGLEAVHVAKVFRTLDINLNGAIGVAEILCLKVHGHGTCMAHSTWTWTWHMHMHMHST